LKREIAVAEKRQMDMQLFSPPPVTAQLNVHVDSMTTGAVSPLQSVAAVHGAHDSPASDNHVYPPAPAPADSQHEIRSALLAPGPTTSADSHAQLLPLPTVDSMNPATAGTKVTATAGDAYALSLPEPAPVNSCTDSLTSHIPTDTHTYPPVIEMRSAVLAPDHTGYAAELTSSDGHTHPPLLPAIPDGVIYTAAGLIQSTATASERAAVMITDYARMPATVSYPETRSASNSHIYPPPPDSVRAVPGLTVDYAHRQLTGSLAADNTLMSGRAALPVFGTIDSSSVDNNTLSVHINRQLIGNNPDVDNVLMNNSVRPAPVDRKRAVPVASRPMTSDYNYLYPPPTAPYLGMSSAAATDHVRPPPPLQVNSGHALPGTFVPIVQQQLTDSRGMENVFMNDRALPIMTSDMIAVAVSPQTLMSTGYDYLQPRLLHVPFCAAALPAHYSIATVNTDHALPVVNISQFSTMTADRRDVAMPLYTVPSAVSTVTAAAPLVVHTSSSSSSNVCDHQAPSGALITHTPQGLMISFSLGTYPGRGSAAMPVGYPDPGFALPTPMVNEPTASVVHPALTLPSALPVADSLPLLTDITTTTTVTTATAVTESVVVASVSSKLATGFEFLALAPRPPGVKTHSSGQTLPVPVAALPTVLPFAVTTSATIQQPGGATTVTTTAPTSTAATVPAVLPASTMTSSVAPIPMSATTAPAVVTPLPITTSTVALASSSTGIAVSVSSDLNPPGNSYVTSTRSVTLPVIVVYSQDVLKRYDGSTSPREYMKHFDIIADVNG